ncbi:MAG: hypothetical protein AAGA29_07085 [Planctomycetota bacterium]
MVLVLLVAFVFFGRFVERFFARESGVVLGEQVFVAGGEAVLLRTPDLFTQARGEVVELLVAIALGVEFAGGRVALREG